MRQLYSLIYKIDYFRPIYSPNDNICDYYLIDRECNIYSLYYGKFLDDIISESGYHLISLNTKDGRRIQRRIHRLGMMTFCYFPGCEELQVDHKDGNKDNNNISNLEWVTGKENVNRAINLGLRRSWSDQNNPCAKLTNEQVLDIVNMIINKLDNNTILQKYPNINESIISGIAYGNTWKNIVTPEMVTQMKISRNKIILTDDQKHLICNYFQNNPKIYNYKGSVKDYIIQTLTFLNIPLNDSTFRMTKRLYYKYQDPEITSQYNY
jgi:hypothetical protein